jgi:hypothetical protein
VRILIYLIFVLGLSAGVIASPSIGAATDCSTAAYKQYKSGACELADLVAAASVRMNEPTKALMAKTCSSASSGGWLVGTWKIGKITLSIKKQSDGYVWHYDRKAGQMTKIWGKKATAQAKGRVDVVKGCAVELKGAYTAYGGKGARGRDPIGWPMTYSLALVKPYVLVGEGLGYGQRKFRTYFKKK